MDINVIGRIRKALEGIDAAALSDEEQFTLTQQLEQLVAPGAAPYQEIVRLGRAYQVGTTTAVAAVIAIPSTANLLAIYNNEPDGGRSLIIDWVAAVNGASTAVANQAQMLGLIGQVREAIITTLTVTPKKMNGMGGGANDSKVRTTVNTAVPANTGVAADWFPIGPSFLKTGVAATPGYGTWVPVDGRIIVPPGRYFALHVLASVVGETFNVWCGWHEKQLTLV